MKTAKCNSRKHCCSCLGGIIYDMLVSHWSIITQKNCQLNFSRKRIDTDKMKNQETYT